MVDDEPNHRRSAEILLKGHDLTIVDSFDKAREALTPQLDRPKFEKLKAGGMEFSEAWDTALVHPDFDVVMTDLLMPASREAQGGEGMRLVGTQMPLGNFLILMALAAEIKNIAMVTDMNHHNHPASAALDPINRKVISVGETKIFATNHAGSQYFDEKTNEPVSWEFLRTPKGKEKYPGDYGPRQGTFSGKGWGSVLKTLLEGKFQE